MPYHGILFDRSDTRPRVGAQQEPPFLSDLNLDQVLESMIAGREEYHLEPFFYASLHDVDAVRYRHEVLRDLEQTALYEAVTVFAQSMRAMRERLAQAKKLRYRYQNERLFVDAVATYCEAVASLAGGLAQANVKSRGFQEFRGHLTGYTDSDAFTSLAAETRRVTKALAEVKYGVHIKGNRVTVRRYDGEADYGAEVEETFAKFKQGAVKDYLVTLPDPLDLNHVEAQVLDLVARLFPKVFGELDDFNARHRGYLDDTIKDFDREIQFYLAYLEFIEPLKAAELEFCYPRVSARSKEIRVVEGFDLALGKKLVGENSSVVCNDFFLQGSERILVVTGPNQGGKTTFARMFGQLHHLASLGLPVPGREARLFLADRLFSHFEREEDISTLRGKLEDELVRLRDILERATKDSVVVVNESLTSTTLGDSLYLGQEVLKQIIDLDLPCVWVTFVDELASVGEATVSMVAMVDPDNPAVRTYEIVRKPADGLAYAAAIAAKYGLTYQSVKERIGS
ncbi:MAG: DNA mismatch repair protein MutS [Actinomycetota bacterium]